MDNPEEVLHCLDEFAKLKPKDIPRELEEYLMYVARTGDPVYQWPLVKCLFREKLLNVITEFYETTPTLDLPPSPNVDPFNYENMKRVLLERLEAFSNAPFTVQRLCELLTTPRKEYNRPDKFMRAIEKNILVVSTREPGNTCRPDSALSEPLPNGVSESVETANIPNISNDYVSEEPSEAAPSGDSVENHVAGGSESDEHPNHIDSVVIESSEERVASVEGEVSVNLTKEAVENSVVADKNGSSSIDVDSSRKPVEGEEMPDSASDAPSQQPDCIASTDADVAPSSSTEPSGTASVSSSSPTKTSAASNSSIAEDISAQSTILCETLTECTGNGMSDCSVEGSVSDNESTEKETPSGSNTVADVIGTAEVCEQSVHVEKEIISAGKKLSVGIPVLEDRTLEETVKSSEAHETSNFNEAAVNSDTVTDKDQKKSPEPIASPTDIKEGELGSQAEEIGKNTETSEVVENSTKVEAIESMKPEVAADSSATVVNAVGSSSVDVEKFQETECVASSEESIAVDQACEEEAMDVDEGSNQPTDVSEAEAMAVAEEAEPMDDSDQPAVEEMS